LDSDVGYSDFETQDDNAILDIDIEDEVVVVVMVPPSHLLQF
jgi:hypothetical protein